ncbi:MAG TPA: cell envelope integrity protein TolA [Hansschlegelia sp.]
MKLRPGLTVSATAHGLLLAWGLISLSSARQFDVGPTEALPIEVISSDQFDAMTKGSKTSKKVDAPKVKAEKVAEAEADPKDDALPVQKEDVEAAPPPPPPSASAPTEAEAPPKADPKPDPEAAKAAAAKAAAEKAAKAEADKAAAAKAEQQKAAAEKAAAKAEAEKVAQEKAEQAEKLAEAADAERLAKAEAAKAAKDKAEAEKAAQAEADRAAKEQAEKQAKADAAKAAKAEADRVAKAEAAAAAKAAKEKADAEKAAKAKERKFDPSKVASLLGDKASSSDSAMKDARDPGRKATAAREIAPETTAGTARGTASKLSMSARTGIDNAVREQVMQCWNPPVGATGDGSLAVKVQFTLNADGTLSSAPTVMNSSSNPAFRAAAGAATRAVQRCSPLKLPAEAYDYWRQVNINFDPKDMMGG